MQTKKQSFIEICTSTAVGFAVSLTATFFIMPLFGLASTPVKNLGITVFYTVISIIRGYVIRRWFNKKSMVPKNTDKSELIYSQLVLKTNEIYLLKDEIEKLRVTAIHNIPVVDHEQLTGKEPLGNDLNLIFDQ